MPRIRIAAPFLRPAATILGPTLLGHRLWTCRLRTALQPGLMRAAAGSVHWFGGSAVARMPCRYETGAERYDRLGDENSVLRGTICDLEQKLCTAVRLLRSRRSAEEKDVSHSDGNDFDDLNHWYESHRKEDWNAAINAAELDLKAAERDADQFEESEKNALKRRRAAEEQVEEARKRLETLHAQRRGRDWIDLPVPPKQ